MKQHHLLQKMIGVITTPSVEQFQQKPWPTHLLTLNFSKNRFKNMNRYRRKHSKVNASIFDSALSHTRRSDASEKKEKKIIGQIRLWTSFESLPVSVKSRGDF